MKFVLILALGGLAMASAEQVNVVDNSNPEQVNVVDANPEGVRVVDQPQGQFVQDSYFYGGPNGAAGGRPPPGYHGPNGLNYPPASYYDRPSNINNGPTGGLIVDPWYSGGGQGGAPPIQFRKQYDNPAARNGK